MKLSFTELSLRGRIDELLPRVAKPARYMGGELNSICKPPEKVSVRFALAFPDVYEVGMSNLGLRILYSILNAEPEVAAERVFAPASDMEEEMRCAGLPLFSLESSLPVRAFDLIGFSLAYEMSYTTVLNMLDLAHIPLAGRDRTDEDPIVIAGGHCATNPEPMADYIDAFAIGDGEEVVLDIVRAYQGSADRETALRKLSEVEGVYVPSVHTDKPRVRGRVVKDLEHATFPDKLVVPLTEAVHDRVAVEIMRGCSRGCRFCQAGMITRPVRQRSPGTLCEQVNTLLENTGYEEIALTSLSSADHSAIGDLVHTLIETHEADGVGVSLPSLRADAACVALAADIQKVRKSGLTFAPEAGTQRLRDVINKNVTEDDLLGAVEAAVECGWRRIKLYFMVGLPTETDEDLEGIGQLVSRVIDIGRKHRTPLALNVTISPFVPKPHTPFQWRGMAGLEELERKIAMLRPLLRGKNISLSWHDPASCRIEAVLARGDRKLGEAIRRVWEKGGKLEQDNFEKDRWLNAFSEAGLDIEYYANREIPIDEPLAWDHIDVGVSKRFLAKENERADNSSTTADCRFGACSACGVREALAAAYGPGVLCPPPAPESPALIAKEEPAVRRDRAVEGSPILFTFRKGEEARWLGHLDLMRVFERAIRISGIDVVYTQGFNPRIKMSIASALPLGATADREIVVIHIAGSLDLKDILSRLNGCLPHGVSILSAEVLPESRRKIAVTASEFIAEVTLPENADSVELTTAIEELMNKAEIPAVRESGNQRKKIDLRPGVESLAVVGKPAGPRAHIAMRLPHLQFTVKPAEIIKVLAESVPGLELISVHRSYLITDAPAS